MTPLAAAALTRLRLRMSTIALRSGNIIARAYAIDPGAEGGETPGQPGAVLAESDPVAAALLPLFATIGWVDFPFSGVNKLALAQGVPLYFGVNRGTMAGGTVFVFSNTALGGEQETQVENSTWTDNAGLLVHELYGEV